MRFACTKCSLFFTGDSRSHIFDMQRLSWPMYKRKCKLYGTIKDQLESDKASSDSEKVSFKIQKILSHYSHGDSEVTTESLRITKDDVNVLEVDEEQEPDAVLSETRGNIETLLGRLSEVNEQIKSKKFADIDGEYIDRQQILDEIFSFEILSKFADIVEIECLSHVLSSKHVDRVVKLTSNEFSENEKVEITKRIFSQQSNLENIIGELCPEPTARKLTLEFLNSPVLLEAMKSKMQVICNLYCLFQEDEKNYLGFIKRFKEFSTDQTSAELKANSQLHPHFVRSYKEARKYTFLFEKMYIKLAKIANYLLTKEKKERVTITDVALANAISNHKLLDMLSRENIALEKLRASLLQENEKLYDRRSEVLGQMAMKAGEAQSHNSSQGRALAIKTRLTIRHANKTTAPRQTGDLTHGGNGCIFTTLETTGALEQEAKKSTRKKKK